MKPKPIDSNYTRKPRIFNQPERFIEGWYWVLPSHKLLVGEVKPITILGKELVIYRGEDGLVVIFDAYCPHMGAHLGEGKVEGNELRCFLHHWQYDQQGFCTKIPCLDESIDMTATKSIKARNWPTEEKYGLIWVWTGENPQQSLPFIPELEVAELDIAFGGKFLIHFHPHIVMVNPIDAQHFYNIHRPVWESSFQKQELNENAIIFRYNQQCNNYNSNSPIKILRSLLKRPITYHLCYWYGSTLILRVEIRFLHFQLNCHILYALRLIESGKTTGIRIFIGKKRPGIIGHIYGKFLLWLSKIVINVINYMSNEHGGLFPKTGKNNRKNIQFNLQHPLELDQPIIEFISHLERQKPLKWGTWSWERFRDNQQMEPEKPQNLQKWRDDLAND
jgi:aminopyrrolnitrin oxygenase